MRRAFATAILMTTALAAADLSGIWVGRIPGRNGAMLDISFQFVQTGNALEGKLYGDYRSTTFRGGTVTGDQVGFVVVSPEQAGNQINETRLRFTGALKDGELELTREREASTNAGNAGAFVQTKPEPKQTFRLKRLI